MTSEFGFVTLDLTEVYERDQGIYTCKAWNRSGEAFTSTTIYCTGKEGLVEKTQHPKGQVIYTTLYSSIPFFFLILMTR